MSIINTNLEKEFNLAPLSEKDVESTEEPIIKRRKPSFLDLDKIDTALPEVNMDSTDKEFDDLVEKALKAHEDLMDLAMNVEQRFSGEIASTAASMLGHAITAKTNKIRKKLDMIDLQIKKKMVDFKCSQKENKSSQIENKADNEVSISRSELLDKIINDNHISKN